MIFDKIIKGNSPAIKKDFSLMEKATKSNITVSITGETGTGKELVAKAISL
jgi:two-component system response regulator AtoC